MNVSERLARLQIAVPAIGEEVVSQDIERGHAALKRTRTRRRAIGGGFAFAIAVAALIGSNMIVDAEGRDQLTADGVQTGVNEAAPAVQLVAYAGAQPPGFTLASIPNGFVVQGAAPDFLTLARPGDGTAAESFVDKVVVMLKSKDATGPGPGTAVTVNGHPGVISDGGGARLLRYSDGSNHLVLQAWDSIGLTDAQLVALAEGVAVTSESIAPVG
ncbi:hypothetical protein [Prescottella equi]